MHPLPVAHIGILVSDVEKARQNWANALGKPFSTVVRYRSAAWSGIDDPIPHSNDLRQVIFSGISPSIEIQEFAQNSSHAEARGEGGHHFSFPPVQDNNVRKEQLAAMGIGMAGGSNYEGRWIIQFSDPGILNNVSTEWVEESPGHLDLKDDGTPLDRLFEAESLAEFNGERPDSDIVEFGVRVKDLESALRLWPEVTGYTFEMDSTHVRSAVTQNLMPAIRLVESHQTSDREGLYYALVKTRNIQETLQRLRCSEVPLVHSNNLSPEQVEVDPDYLNGFSLRFKEIS